MCLAVPAKVVELSDDDAVVDVGGNRMEANVCLLDDVQVGDYVLVLCVKHAVIVGIQVVLPGPNAQA